jgi:hypothetical protein
MDAAIGVLAVGLGVAVGTALGRLMMWGVLTWAFRKAKA